MACCSILYAQGHGALAYTALHDLKINVLSRILLAVSLAASNRKSGSPCPPVGGRRLIMPLPEELALAT